MKKIFFFISILFFSIKIHSSPKVLCTSVPLASLISMIGGKNIEVKTLQKTHGCIHHFHLSPRDVNMILNQDLIIYVSDSFESFLSKVKHKNKMSLSNGLDEDIKHIWLHIPSVRKSLSNISEKLSEDYPEYRVDFMANLSISLKKLDEMEVLIRQILEENKSKIIITSKEMKSFLEYFAIDYLYKNPEYINDMKEIIDLSNQGYKVILTEHSQNKKLDKVVKKENIIHIKDENWNMYESNLDEIYFDNMIKIARELTE